MITEVLNRIAPSGAHPVFDAVDYEIVQKRLRLWNENPRPRVGDWLVYPDGTGKRFSHDWGNGLQVSAGGSFYLGNGWVEFSGSLDPSIPDAQIKPTDRTLYGTVWIFHHNDARAHNGVVTDIPCRVYEYTPKE
jgi:hypothetical protein